MGKIIGILVKFATFPGLIVDSFINKYVVELFNLEVNQIDYFPIEGGPGVVHEKPNNIYSTIGIALLPFIIQSLLAYIVLYIGINLIQGTEGLASWLGISIAAHSFPNPENGKNLWKTSINEIKENKNVIAIIGFPLALIIYIVRGLHFLWVDILYGFFLLLIVEGEILQPEFVHDCDIQPKFITWLDNDLYPCEKEILINSSEFIDFDQHWSSQLESNIGTFHYDVQIIGSTTNRTILNTETKAIRIQQLENFYEYNQFEGLHGLEYLDIIDFPTDTIPEEIWNLENLKILKLTTKKLRLIPDEISKLKNLEVLILNINDNLEYLSPNVFKLPKLESLKLDRLYKLDTSYIIDNYKHLNNIKYLSLAESSKHSSIIDFSKLNSLNYLSVPEWNNSMANLDSLIGLRISRVAAEESYEAISKMENLEELIISINNKKSFEHLSNIENLSMLYLNTDLEYITQNLNTKVNDLDYLSLAIDHGSSPKISDSTLRNFQNIKYLSVHLKNKNETKLDEKLLSDRNVRYFNLTGRIPYESGIRTIGDTRAKFNSINN